VVISIPVTHQLPTFASGIDAMAVSVRSTMLLKVNSVFFLTLSRSSLNCSSAFCQ